MIRHPLRVGRTRPGVKEFVGTRASRPVGAHPLTSRTVDRDSALAVAFGGTAGAGARWAIVELLDGAVEDPGAWPWGVFVANVIGCLLLGAAVTGLRRRPPSVVLGATVGFCGALTTFSAFAMDAALFLRADEHTRLVAYIVVSFAVGAVAYLAGSGLGRRMIGTS